MSFRPATFAEAKAKHKPMRRKRLEGTAKPQKQRRRMRKKSKKRQAMSPEEEAWRLGVLERDGYICRKCGKPGGLGMHAHHVAPRGRRPDLILDPRNGIAVHGVCHSWIHDNPREAERLGLINFDSYELAMKIKAGYIVPGGENDTRITL